MDNFKEFLQRYLDKSATPTEREEFFFLLDTGAYDHLITREMVDVWANQASASDDERKLLARVYDRIHAMHIPGTATVVPIEKRDFRIWMAAAAVIVIALMAVVLMMKGDDLFRDGSVTQQKALNPFVYTGKQVVVLPDSTEVIMNEQSELSYDSNFGKKNREVFFSGEGYFDVKRDVSKPFIVHTGKVSTKVLGTAFNINAYAVQHKVTVTVVHGLVQVSDDRNIYGKIKPGEQIEVDVPLNAFVKRNTKTEEALTWQKDFFILDNVTFAQAADRIEKRFNVKVSITNESLKGCLINAWFLNNETLEEIVEGLSLIKQATATINGDNIIIEDGTGCKP